MRVTTSWLTVGSQAREWDPTESREALDCVDDHSYNEAKSRDKGKWPKGNNEIPKKNQRNLRGANSVGNIKD